MKRDNKIWMWLLGCLQTVIEHKPTNRTLFEEIYAIYSLGGNTSLK